MKIRTKTNRVKILRTLKAENAEKLRSISFYSKKDQSHILDELLEGYEWRKR
jgi:hypothetical protein